jgi:hypothetical protein
MSLGFALELGSATMSFAPATSCTVPVTTSASSYRFGDRIENTQFRLEEGRSGESGWGFIHGIERHEFGRALPRTSEFGESFSQQEIKNMIIDAVKNGTSWQRSGGKDILHYDTGKFIGTDRFGNQTSILKIISDPLHGNSITSFYPSN